MEAPRTLYFFWEKDCDGHTLKAGHSQDPLNKHYLEHFDKLAGFQPPQIFVGNRVKLKTLF